MNLESGIYKDISHNDYHALPHISNSYLGRLDKCPAYAHVPQEETAAMLFGRAVHVLILEGVDKFNSEFAVAPQVDRRTKSGKAEWAAFQDENPNKTIITNEDYETCVSMYNAVAYHPFAAKLLSEGLSEQTVLWTDKDTKLPCRCRPDRIPDGDKGVIVDLKSTADASETSFLRSVMKYGYARQAGMYIDGLNHVSSKAVDAFVFIAVEKTPPYRTEVYVLEDAFVSWGVQEYRRLLEVEKECREKNEWPHYINAGATELYLPNYR